MKQLNLKDIISGSVIILIGAFFAAGANRYGIGTPTHMGPGFFPGALGITSILLGIAIIGKGLRTTGQIQVAQIRPIAGVLAGVAVFALMIDRVGLIPATFVSVLVFSLGNRNATRPLFMVIIATVVSVMIWLVFIVGLDLPVPALKRWP